MRVPLVCALLPLLAALLLPPISLTTAALSPPERSYNFLMLLPMGSKSHRNVFMPLATALTARGHKVTMVSGYPPADKNPNITYIDHGLLDSEKEYTNMFDMRTDSSKMIDLFCELLPKVAKDLYSVPAIMSLYNKRKEFDLIIIDSLFNEAAYPFAHEQSFITIAPAGVDPFHSAVLGNILNPAIVSPVIKDFPTPMSFFDRSANIFTSIFFPFHWRYISVVPLIQKELNKHFPDLPSLLEIERNQSLALLNSHFSLFTPVPLVPGQVEVGGMHCRPGKPLPKDLNDFVSGKEPVVYFSLGSVAQGSTMPQRYQKILVSAFKRLPYKVLWKFEEKRDDLSKNVMIQKWIPQQDVLAHPNVKLFISHCGLLSTQEAMYHGKPVLGLPIFGDQPRNAKKLQQNGMGKMLVWEELTEDVVVDYITELVSNGSYLAKISGVSKTFRDQPQTPVDRAVFWTEYVIRHYGAVHIRSPERDLTWIEVLHLDVIFTLHIILLLTIKIVKILCGFCCGSKSKQMEIKRKAE